MIVENAFSEFILSINIVNSLLVETTSFTIKNGSVYKQNSNYSSDIVFTIKDGKIYDKQYTYSSDILANIGENIVYNKNSSYSSDILFRYNGLLTIEEFVAVWYVYKYVY